VITSRRVVARAAGTALLIALGAACFRSKLPPLEQYRLAPAPTATALASSPVPGPLPGSVAVSRFNTPGVYGGAQIVYRIGETGYGTYPNREWALPLGEMLGILAEESIRAEPLGSAVVYEPATRRQFGYEWKGSVRQFEEVNRDRQVFVSVHLEARLLRMADDSILWLGERHVELPVPQPTMINIVDALSTAARQAMRELVLDAKTAARSVAAKDSLP
jgi:ABC-type uncharacterized transport system auxiliary subunit